MTVIGGKVRISSGLRGRPRSEAGYMSALPPTIKRQRRDKQVNQGDVGARAELYLDTAGASIYVQVVPVSNSPQGNPKVSSIELRHWIPVLARGTFL